MSVARTPSPSPFTGEVAERTEAGEGSQNPGRRGPSPGRSLRSRPTSPVKGEGKIAADRVMRQRARALRVAITDAERKLWYALRDRRFSGFKFRRQVPIGRFIVDFVCFERRLVIEVDGGQHADSARDVWRHRWFVANDFRVLRFWNNDVLCNLEGVLTMVAQALQAEQRR